MKGYFRKKCRPYYTGWCLGSMLVEFLISSGTFLRFSFYFSFCFMMILKLKSTNESTIFLETCPYFLLKPIKYNFKFETQRCPKTARGSQ